MPIKSDAQAKRTRSWIVSALLKLMDQYAFNEITISQIAGQAGIDRRTYYRHFKSKEDILTCYIQKIAQEYATLFLEQQKFDTRAIAISFFTICQKHRDDLFRLHNHKLMPLLLDEFDKLFLHFHNKNDVINPEDFQDKEYVIPFIAGGFWHMLQKWISDDMQKTAAELADILLQFLPEYI